MQTLINYWPENIREPSNKNRSMTIMVNEIGLLDGVMNLGEDFVENVKSMGKQIYDGAKDMIDSSDESGSGDATEADAQYINNKLMSSKKGDSVTVWSCVLPLPNELGDRQSHSWGTEQSALSKITNSVLNTSVGGVSATQIAREMANRTGQRQPMVNPGYYQDYTGSALRAFSFSWELVPENAMEAKQIMDILMKFKRYSSPKVTLGRTALLSPYSFDVIIGNEQISAVMNMTGVVITNISIDYANDGGLQFYNDGTPKTIRLGIDFAERELSTSANYGDI